MGSVVFDSCSSLGVATVDDEGSALLLYRRVTSTSNATSQTLLIDFTRPLRLLFLDVDGVLNTAGEVNSGTINYELLVRSTKVVEATNASVVLSSSWRSFACLRALIIAALPFGVVVGQTR